MGSSDGAPAAPRLVVCDMGALTDPDAATVDALARLQLAVRRHGCQVVLSNASPELVDLLAFAGLGGVLAVIGGPSRQRARQAEEREQLRVEEQRHPDDPAV